MKKDWTYKLVVINGLLNSALRMEVHHDREYSSPTYKVVGTPHELNHESSEQAMDSYTDGLYNMCKYVDEKEDNDERA